MVRDCLQQELEKEKVSKELAASQVRRQLEADIGDLELKNQQMKVIFQYLWQASTKSGLNSTS